MSEDLFQHIHYQQYLSLKEQYPNLFLNTPDFGIDILNDPADIEQAIEAGKLYLQSIGCDPAWSKVGLLYENESFSIVRDPVRFPNGKLGIYFRMLMSPEHGPGSVVFPVYENKVILLEQYRHATRQKHLEIPRGFGEPGINPADNAHKEIREEIEGEIAELIPLGSMHVNTGITNEYVELFFAQMSRYGQGDSGEGIENILLCDIPTLEHYITEGKVTDSFTLSAFTRARLKQLI